MEAAAHLSRPFFSDFTTRGAGRCRRGFHGIRGRKQRSVTISAVATRPPNLGDDNGASRVLDTDASVSSVRESMMTGILQLSSNLSLILSVWNLNCRELEICRARLRELGHRWKPMNSCRYSWGVSGDRIWVILNLLMTVSVSVWLRSVPNWLGSLTHSNLFSSTFASLTIVPVYLIHHFFLTIWGF